MLLSDCCNKLTLLFMGHCIFTLHFFVFIVLFFLSFLFLFRLNNGSGAAIYKISMGGPWPHWPPLDPPVGHTSWFVC